MVLATGSYFHSLPKNAITVEGRSSHGRAEGPSKGGGGGGGGSVMAERQIEVSGKGSDGAATKENKIRTIKTN